MNYGTFFNSILAIVGGKERFKTLRESVQEENRNTNGLIIVPTKTGENFQIGKISTMHQMRLHDAMIKTITDGEFTQLLNHSLIIDALTPILSYCTYRIVKLKDGFNPLDDYADKMLRINFRKDLCTTIIPALFIHCIEPFYNLSETIENFIQDFPQEIGSTSFEKKNQDFDSAEL